MENYLEQSEYFKYLKQRSSFSLLLRRFFFIPVVKYFTGRVLDIGSGIGEFLEYYSDSIGIDVDLNCVSYCNSKGFKCIVANAYRIPFKNNSFDGILLNNILEHLDEPEDAFSEIKRVLKGGGKLLIELPGKKGFYYDRTHVRFWQKKDIISFLEKNGFRKIKTRFFPVPFKFAGDFLTHNKLRIFAVNY